MKKRRIVLVVFLFLTVIFSLNLEEKEFINLSSWRESKSFSLFGLELFCIEKKEQKIKAMIVDLEIALRPGGDGEMRAFFYKEKVLGKFVVNTFTNFQNGELYYKLKKLAEMHAVGETIRQEEVEHLVSRFYAEN